MFETFRDSDNALDWADYVFASRYTKYTGEDENLAKGEELELIATMSKVIDSMTSREDFLAKPKYTSYIKELAQRQTPDWAHSVFCQFARNVGLSEGTEVGELFGSEFELLLKQGPSKPSWEGLIFEVWMRKHESSEALLGAMVLPEFARFYTGIFWCMQPRRRPTGTNRMSPPTPTPTLQMIAGLDVATVVEKARTILDSEHLEPKGMKALIAEVGKYEHGMVLIKEGIARRDEYLPDYLAALGYKQTDPDILAQLTKEADSQDAATAIGAIHGLRQWGNSDGDSTLRRVLEQGSNIGVKSHALGALLDRTPDANARDTLLEKYLDANKSASLRAVAVSHVPETDIKRLQKIVDEDNSARVRTAALQRLGAISKSLKSDRELKSIRAWFL
ncbi:MAG: HEAT repeat domain-containing protein, partial [Planctomycetota bacterium]